MNEAHFGSQSKQLARKLCFEQEFPHALFDGNLHAMKCASEEGEQMFTQGRAPAEVCKEFTKAETHTYLTTYLPTFPAPTTGYVHSQAMYTHFPTSPHTHTFVQGHACTRSHTHARTHTYVQEHTCTRTHTHTRTHTRTCEANSSVGSMLPCSAISWPSRVLTSPMSVVQSTPICSAFVLVRVCMCMCVHASVRVCMCICMHACIMFACVARMHVYMYECMYLCLNVLKSAFADHTFSL